ncbi:hypothetical protein BD769DRAFT_1670961 [Suillus cothurnatus]|nr:hypothetical protein BD769DRAFT_1670961 [Suillus cothurnatus]
MSEPSITELLQTSKKDCAIIFIECQSLGDIHICIISNKPMNAEFEASSDQMIYTGSPSIIATNTLYNEPSEFDRTARRIMTDPKTFVVYTE